MEHFRCAVLQINVDPYTCCVELVSRDERRRNNLDDPSNIQGYRLSPLPDPPRGPALCTAPNPKIDPLICRGQEESSGKELVFKDKS